MVGTVLKTAVLLTVLWVTSPLALGAGATPSADPQAPLPFDLSGKGDAGMESTDVSRELLVKTLLSLVLVLGMGVGVIWATKRLLPRLGVKAGKDIRVLETTGLGPRRALHLVQVGSQQLLIGSTPDQISMLTVVNTGFAEVMDARLDTEEN